MPPEVVGRLTPPDAPSSASTPVGTAPRRGTCGRPGRCRVEVGERACNAQHTMIAPRGEPHRIGRVTDQRERRGVELHHLVEQRALRGRVGAHVRARRECCVALSGLHRPRARHAGRDLAAALGGRRQDQVGGADRRHLDVQVDAVEQRAGEPRLILAGAARQLAAMAGEAGLARAAAAARVHGGDQHEARRIGDAVVGARDRDLAALERLAQRVEHARIELGEFVEKQHAAVRERDLARLGAQAAADQRRHAGRVMRRAERPCVGQRAAFELAGDRGDHRDLEQLGRHERRQDRRQPRRQHRLAGARRPDHQQIVPAGGRDLERTLGAFLAADVLEIERRARAGADLRLRPQQHLRALHVVGELNERRRRHDLHLGARPRGFRPARGRTDQALAVRIGADRGRQHAGDRRDRAVEPELAEHHIAVERIGRDRADRRHQAERDRQVVVAAFLRQVGRGEVHGDAARRQREPGRGERGAHPLARLGYRLVAEAHHVERRQAGRDLHLHGDATRLDAFERDG